MRKQTRYSPEVRERAIRLVYEHQKEYELQWAGDGIDSAEIRHRGPWRNIEEVEFATLEWIDWFNNRRLLEPIGNIPPVEFEIAYYQQMEESAEAA